MPSQSIGFMCVTRLSGVTERAAVWLKPSRFAEIHHDFRGTAGASLSRRYFTLKGRRALGFFAMNTPLLMNEGQPLSVARMRAELPNSPAAKPMGREHSAAALASLRRGGWTWTSHDLRTARPCRSSPPRRQASEPELPSAHQALSRGCIPRFRRRTRWSWHTAESGTQPSRRCLSSR